jgi:flagellin
MGLRVNTNLSSVSALRNLRVVGRSQARSLERLSTGQRINQASDDPSGLVISERLRAQIGSLNQSIRNSEDASNLIGTAESALQEVANLLSGLRESAVFAANDGAASSDQIAAEQAAVDSALNAIDLIARTTRFGTKGLLNGESDFRSSTGNDQFARVELTTVNFAGAATTSLNMSVAAGGNAQRAEVNFSSAGATTRTVRVSGNKGSADVSLAADATGQQAADAINTFRDVTGAFASATAGRVAVLSGDFGSDAFVRVDVLEGTVNNVTFRNDAFAVASAPGSAGTSPNLAEGKGFTDTGKDITVSVNGVEENGQGNVLRINNGFVAGEVEFRQDDGIAVAAGSSQGIATAFSRALDLDSSGVQFQLNANAGDSVNVGIRNIATSNLGERGQAERGNSVVVDSEGFLNSLKTGGDNDLFSNSANAIRVIDTAIDQVSRQRAFLGGLQSFTIDSNISSLEVAVENISATESNIRDLDFAEESANFTRTQILFQAGTAVLANANLVPQSALTLLT